MVREVQQTKVYKQPQTIHTILKGYENKLQREGRKTGKVQTAFKILDTFLNGYDPLLIDHKDAQEFQSYLVSLNKYVPGSILCIVGTLSSFYDYLRKRRFIPVNPFSLVDRIKLPEKIPGHIPTEKEIDFLLSYLKRFTRGKNLRFYKRDYKAHILCELLYSTGMRIHEAAAIRLEDLDFYNSTVLIHDSKTNSERTGFLNEYVKSILEIYVSEFREKVLWLSTAKEEDLLFGSSVNLGNWINTILAEACKAVKMEPITAHMFRHAFGYHMLRSGCDIRKIQQFLGHSNLNTTAVYTKVDTEALRNIIDQYHPRNSPIIRKGNGGKNDFK